MLVEIVRSPSLLRRVRSEIAASFLEAPSPEHLRFDVAKLCSRPLLQSIYAETLRLRSAIFTFRSPQYQDLDIGGWRFPQNATVVMLSSSAHMDRTVWNAGHDSSHPVEEFWSERFLIYPDDPGSGPSKMASDIAVAAETADARKSEPGEPRFSLEGVEGSWMPYGGGMNRCPGRHLAKQEILLTVAVFLSIFDIDLYGTDPSALTMDMKYYGLGTLPPKGKAPFRIRRRSLANC